MGPGRCFVALYLHLKTRPFNPYSTTSNYSSPIRPSNLYSTTSNYSSFISPSNPYSTTSNYSSFISPCNSSTITVDHSPPPLLPPLFTRPTTSSTIPSYSSTSLTLLHPQPDSSNFSTSSSLTIPYFVPLFTGLRELENTHKSRPPYKQRSSMSDCPT
ncbi:hypothetical protein Pmani_034178 [Petrolisthes manimaculis]|uniref:Uncharacterized protein n=1 Tax=Petrolisthes manimaculis TaxID=1843537 RepID=A0AAE1NPY4_9EUCA|nr:hypothetical protein Pmani_034178 [Petrolisthes manimaculis]